MPEYIAKFLSKGIRHLLKGNGRDFLNEYYDTIEKIYNCRIPLRDIASKGKIKKSIKEYLQGTKELNKAGRPKSRQAWYELAIANNLSVNNGDTIYYINTGTKKTESDVAKNRKYYSIDIIGEEINISKDLEKQWKAYKKSNDTKFRTKEEFGKANFQGFRFEDEITLKCMLVPNNIIDSDDDVYCSDFGEDMEYNVKKYITQFNNRIKPLLVCFSKDVRDRILVDNPKDIPYFTDEECVLTSGEPNKASDQDTYEQLMTMEDKEISFWKRYNLVPPFVEECGMGKWEDILADYDRRMKEEMENGIYYEKEAFINAVQGLSSTDIKSLIEDGEIPASILKICEPDPLSANLISKKFDGVVIGTINDLLDRDVDMDEEDDD